jgi:hypothetical protein
MGMAEPALRGVARPVAYGLVLRAGHSPVAESALYTRLPELLTQRDLLVNNSQTRHAHSELLFKHHSDCNSPGISFVEPL